MKPPKGKPCVECPFRRKSLQGYLGAATPSEFIVTAHSGRVPMPCHMEVDYERKDWKKQQEKVHQCSGHAIYLSNSCKMPESKDVKTLPKDTKTVFNWPHEMLSYHTNGKVTNIVEAQMALFSEQQAAASISNEDNPFEDDWED